MGLSIGTESVKSEYAELHEALMKMLVHHLQILSVVKLIGMTPKLVWIKSEVSLNLD